jgi:TonB-dependent SusC/RagA subfamily outer membrane receptor
MRIKIFLFSFLTSFQILFASDEPLLVPSSLKAVTVYRSGAEMTHHSLAQLGKGNHDLIIENISNTVDINSIQVSCHAAVTIMGVEFGNNFLVARETGIRLKLLMDSAGLIQKEIDRVQVQVRTVNELLEVLKANRNIKGEQSGLSVAELMKLMDYYKSKSNELHNELSVHNEKLYRLNEQLTKVGRQIKEEQSRNTSKSGQLKLQLSVATPGKYDFSVSYITPNAWWAPHYDVRVDNISSPLKLVHKAKIAQTTGIDWKKVKLSLSTSLPAQWGNAPILETWFLGYINPVQNLNRNISRSQSLNEVVVTSPMSTVPGIKIEGMGSVSDQNTPMYVVNGVPMSSEEFSKINQSAIKSMEVLKDASATSLYGSRAANGVIMVTLKDGLDDYVTISDNELDITFDIDLPYDVPTNGKEQNAILKETGIDAFYKYYSVPKLDKDAYLVAEITGWEKLNLLPGEANIILEGTYVGKSLLIHPPLPTHFILPWAGIKGL